jgi:ZF-HD class homeobox domain-containing protein
MEPERLTEVCYRECMKNHAAKLGTYAADGCCEYTPDENCPASLTCAACGCHRNFHRKALIDLSTHSASPNSHLAGPNSSAELASKRRSRTRFTEEQKARMLAFAESIGWRIPKKEGGGYAGRREEDDVARFCKEIGVSRQVFKVWMHNHKSNVPNASSTTHTEDTSPADGGGSAGGGGRAGGIEDEIKASYNSI